MIREKVVPAAEEMDDTESVGDTTHTNGHVKEL